MMEEKYECLKLSKQLCFPLYACSRETIKLYKPWLDEIGLTYTQYITMMVLWEQKSLTAKELGRILYLDSGTLTPLLKKLENKGYIKRNRSRKDERNLLLRVTEQGAALKGKAMEMAGLILKHTMLTKNEIDTLYTLLHKVLDRMEGQNGTE